MTDIIVPDFLSANGPGPEYAALRRRLEDAADDPPGTWHSRKNRMPPSQPKGAEGLYAEPRLGAPRQIGDDEIAVTIRKRWRRAPAV